MNEQQFALLIWTSVALVAGPVVTIAVCLAHRDRFNRIADRLDHWIQRVGRKRSLLPRVDPLVEAWDTPLPKPRRVAVASANPSRAKLREAAAVKEATKALVTIAKSPRAAQYMPPPEGQESRIEVDSDRHERPASMPPIADQLTDTAIGRLIDSTTADRKSWRQTTVFDEVM